jgi:hypothetical protein
MRRHLNYGKYVIRHKWYVFLACLRLRVPFLIAILHDWDKFLPDEWLPYARTFYGADGSKQYKPTPAFDTAWNAHQKRNKHHWQYWMLTFDKGNTELLDMPDVYRREMLADWMGAGKALGKPKVWEWYAVNKDKMRLHAETRAWIERQLVILESQCKADMKGIAMGFLSRSWWE